MLWFESTVVPKNQIQGNRNWYRSTWRKCCGFFRIKKEKNMSFTHTSNETDAKTNFGCSFTCPSHHISNWQKLHCRRHACFFYETTSQQIFSFCLKTSTLASATPKVRPNTKFCRIYILEGRWPRLLRMNSGRVYLQHSWTRLAACNVTSTISKDTWRNIWFNRPNE